MFLGSHQLVRRLGDQPGTAALWKRAYNEVAHRIAVMLKSTTRHVHIFAAELQNETFVASDRKLTLDVDPDNEFVWNDTALQKVYREFERLVAAYRGESLTEYNLRRIGSDLEHFIRGLLMQGEIAYNLESRVLNYSMGRPQVANAQDSNWRLRDRK